MANVERLKRLVTVLEAVAADPAKSRDFDMSTWASDFPSCGTHMCACGWATTDPVLAAQGLTLKPYKFNDKAFDITYDGETGFDAVAKFFDISDNDATWLFDPEQYEPDPEDDEYDEFDQAEIPITPVLERINVVIAKADKAA